MPTRPLLIGISPRILRQVPAELGFRGKALQYLEQSVAHWVMSLGATCVMVPTVERDGEIRRAEIHTHDFAAMLDGLVLQGGADLDPGLYGEPHRHIVGATDPVRDRFELDLIRAFISAGKPVFGICRGMQLINVAFGGTLHQDLLAQGATRFPHVDLPVYDEHHHPVSIREGSVLSRWYGGATEGVVNSIHHQGIARPGDGLQVVATAPDGVVEAIWRDAPGFVLGVQWHPEFQDGRDSRLLPADPMMRAFLDAARLRRTRCCIAAAAET
ncbi:gamma-glutamyl-gamma-aminobutyrate hydrolase family protein [Xanthomonadaceae bacterium XH05]|nr:gamma-glutamyl-gamma-aminobutyrate hydrolase family protein [Xanthomonadaceae bacterium XH05]